MEPLEVTDGVERYFQPSGRIKKAFPPYRNSHCSESEFGQPETPRANDLVGSRRATRSSIATTQVVTPKAAAATSSAMVPLSESKLPLRGLRTAKVQSPAK